MLLSCQSPLLRWQRLIINLGYPAFAIGLRRRRGGAGEVRHQVGKGLCIWRQAAGDGGGGEWGREIGSVRSPGVLYQEMRAGYHVTRSRAEGIGRGSTGGAARRLAVPLLFSRSIFLGARRLSSTSSIHGLSLGLTFVSFGFSNSRQSRFLGSGSGTSVRRI